MRQKCSLDVLFRALADPTRLRLINLMAEQEIWGYLLAHYALSALICAAATAAGIDPDRVKFKRTLRVIRRAVGPAFPP